MRAIACAVVAFLPVAAQAGVAPPPFTGLGVNGSVFTSPDGFGAARAKTQEAATSAQKKQQFDLAASPGLKIYVSQEGWQRVTRTAMTAAGFDPGSDTRNLSLFMLGNEQEEREIAGIGSRIESGGRHRRARDALPPFLRHVDLQAG